MSLSAAAIAVLSLSVRLSPVLPLIPNSIKSSSIVLCLNSTLIFVPLSFSEIFSLTALLKPPSFRLPKPASVIPPKPTMYSITLSIPTLPQDPMRPTNPVPFHFLISPSISLTRLVILAVLLFAPKSVLIQFVPSVLSFLIASLHWSKAAFCIVKAISCPMTER